MEKNVGNRDKLIRVVIAFVIAIMGLTGVIDGTIETVLLVVAVLLAITGLFNFCPVYKLLGMNTCKVRT